MSGSVNSAGSLYANSNSVANRFGSSMNTPEMMMAIQMERAGIMDDGIKDQMDDMQKRNDWLKTANDALGTLRAARPTSADAAAEPYGKAPDGQDMQKWFSDQGISIEHTGGDNKGKQSEFDAAIANLKSAIDTVNSQSQMDMVRLQSMMDKRNQSYDLLTNTLSKNSKQLDSIIGNLR